MTPASTIGYRVSCLRPLPRAVLVLADTPWGVRASTSDPGQAWVVGEQQWPLPPPEQRWLEHAAQQAHAEIERWYEQALAAVDEYLSHTRSQPELRRSRHRRD